MSQDNPPRPHFVSRPANISAATAGPHRNPGGIRKVKNMGNVRAIQARKDNHVGPAVTANAVSDRQVSGLIPLARVEPVSTSSGSTKHFGFSRRIFDGGVEEEGYGEESN